MNFKVGDVVRLIGGHTLMTVSSVDCFVGDPTVLLECVWFEGYTLKRAQHPQGYFEHANPIR